MTHPNKSDAEKSSGSKFHRMTRDYGMAGGSSKYKTTPAERLKDETDTPEDSVGFGADSAAASARSDRPARRSAAANPVPTYARGGKVETAASQDKSGLDNQSKLTGPAVRPNRARKHGGGVMTAASQDKLGLDVMSKMSGPVRPDKAPKTGSEREDKSGYTNDDKLPVPGRARGGRTGHGKKGATHVNVIVAPQGGSGAPPAGAGGPPPQLAALAAGAHPPMGAPPMGGPPPGMPPGGPPMPPPGPPPGMPPMRAKGGKVMGGHPDASQDKELIKKTMREEGLVHKAKGGGIHMTAGADSGTGRLEKMGIKVPSHRGSMKPQAV